MFRCDLKPCPSGYFCTEKRNCVPCSSLCTHCSRQSPNLLCETECPGFIASQYQEYGTTTNIEDSPSQTPSTAPAAPPSTPSFLLTSSGDKASAINNYSFDVLTIGITIGILLTVVVIFIVVSAMKLERKFGILSICRNYVGSSPIFACCKLEKEKRDSDNDKPNQRLVNKGQSCPSLDKFDNEDSEDITDLIRGHLDADSKDFNSNVNTEVDLKTSTVKWDKKKDVRKTTEATIHVQSNDDNDNDDDDDDDDDGDDDGRVHSDAVNTPVLIQPISQESLLSNSLKVPDRSAHSCEISVEDEAKSLLTKNGTFQQNERKKKPSEHSMLTGTHEHPTSKGSVYPCSEKGSRSMEPQELSKYGFEDDRSAASCHKPTVSLWDNAYSARHQDHVNLAVVTNSSVITDKSKHGFPDTESIPEDCKPTPPSLQDLSVPYSAKVLPNLTVAKDFETDTNATNHKTSAAGNRDNNIV